MIKWEHLVITASSLSQLKEELSHYGSMGWQAVSMSMSLDYTILLKRPIDIEEQEEQT